MTKITTRLGLSAAATASLGILLGTSSALVPTPDSMAHSQTPATSGFAASCTPEFVQAAASGLGSAITIKPIKDSMFKGATNYVAAKGTRPAFCQVTGSFVTNPETGKTSNFLASFPSNWNGKYLQLGCSGHCGQFYVSDPAMPSVTVTAQGHPGQIIEKGYATFATDEGHEGLDSASWAVKNGKVDQDYVDDFLYRADKVLARLGKNFTTAFYGRVNGAKTQISHSYFEGCSGGGRDAMVAASYFPEEFDGIIAGSPYDIWGVSFHGTAIGKATSRSAGSVLTPGLLSLMDNVVKKQCDALDGVKDGLIQNPAACNFDPERDLPKCGPGSTPGQCFTPEQIETVAVTVNAVTDERGNIVQPGYSVSELGVLGGGTAMLSDPVHEIFVHKNDPGFKAASMVTFRRGGPGPVTGFHAVVPAAEVAAARAALLPGIGTLPENTARLMNSKTKLLMWHNYSDERLTPYMSVNWYNQLARRHGGFDKVQQQVRLFMLPGTAHCSIVSSAPNSFDPITALEGWVEKGHAPESLPAWVADRQYTPGGPKALALKTPNYTMPLCKYPEMARYSGKGDVQDKKNWSCSPSDKRLLTVGTSGRQAGLMMK
ncbi:feruloyl esterase [Novosphingobium sp. PhB165]|uniref:tannase/feruloyl esterase family alpha/beta hydrolase n=1 Tax=Novosphingobium sp. PhB165 TaxID=2485105 RepID=UPI0010D11CF9|nr:tannase/feruloyl esterase family alpha/beta hydrolase [Novosphingobium sp. PhB165]TCM20745.1 feruloyl esterase [Novosphingobium sp. PhB165]